MMLNPDKERSHIAKRDLLRDFLLVGQCLHDQFRRFESSGGLSFSILGSLLGSDANKGLLWRMKDSAHHLCGPVSSPQGRLLDWLVGGLFHECLQLRESAYLAYSYAPRMGSMVEPFLYAEHFFEQNDRMGQQESEDEAAPLPPLPERLRCLVEQGAAVLKQHVERARSLLGITAEVFCAFLSDETENLPLARLCYERREEVYAVFGRLSPALTAGMDGGNSGVLALLAARSFAAGGRVREALAACEEACAAGDEPGRQAETLARELRATPALL